MSGFLLGLAIGFGLAWVLLAVFIVLVALSSKPPVDDEPIVIIPIRENGHTKVLK